MWVSRRSSCSAFPGAPRVWSALFLLLGFFGLPAQAATEPAALPVGASVNQVVDCAVARTTFNQEAYPNYSVRISSTRQGFTLEGKPEENFKVVKYVSVKKGERTEKFERGEKNGVPAEANDFWLEKLGLSNKYNVESMNLFTPQKRSRYTFALRGQESLNGRDVYKVSFKVSGGSDTDLKDGSAWIDLKTCGVVRAEGTFPEVWVTKDARAQLTMTEVKPGLWLPMRQQVDVIVDVPLLTRKRARMLDDFSAYTLQ